MAADILTIDHLDIYKSNAYSEDGGRFDLESKHPPKRPIRSPITQKAEDFVINAELQLSSNPSRDWEVDVKGLISTRKWLQTYGLKRNRLDMHHLLPKIGFKHSDDYDKSLKKPICSRYGISLFQKYLRSDGRSFNIACTKDQLRQIESRLSQAICLYKRRLDWLTSESRRIFGVIQERSVSFVLDVQNPSPQQWNQFKCAMERVIKEQVTQLAKFNIIRSTEDLASYNESCAPVSQESVEGAIKWLWDLNTSSTISRTATCEAVMKALADPNAEAIYLFTEGSASDGSRELLREKLTGTQVPLHVVSYNCSSADTIDFLKDLTRITGGSFHAYAVVMEMDSYEPLPLDPSTNQANILLRKKTYGGVPPGAGMREDVILLFEELEEARSILAQVQALIQEYPDNPNSFMSPEPPDIPSSSKKREATIPNEDESLRSETYMSSREWLEKYGLKSKKLGFYDILSGVAFKHQDGVVDLKIAPCTEYQTDALTKSKLVNARYCDKFPHVRWKNGEVVHVQVTPEIHRNYETRMRLALESMQQRIDWLQQGSRELFGTVIEDQIYFLIDTSASMNSHIQFVKDKLFVLMQEQLRHKQKFNIIAFDTKAYAWKDRLVEVNEKNLHTAWQWVKELVCRGSTNTLGALRIALADHQTQAIYLLSDGRPDQPPKSILAQVQLHPQVPIHTISFNCADKDANTFLCQLAKDTGGRFHYYSENGVDREGPEPWESEDIRLLRQEIEMGLRNLEKVAQLRDECAALGWKKEEIPTRCTRDHLLSSTDRISAVPALSPQDLYRSDRILMDRPQSAPGSRLQPTPPPHSRGFDRQRPNTAIGFRQSSSMSRISFANPPVSSRSPRPMSAISSRPMTATSFEVGKRTKNCAGHTRTSLLRTLSSTGQFGQPTWIMPETRELLERQWQRQQNMQNKENNRKKKKKGSVVMMSSKKWLSKNGLAPKKLTILDALAPTFIPHKSKYVPILNKNVESKVFNDIMPFAHKKGNKKNMNIVNPQAVDMLGYKKKVEKARENYVRRLDRISWTALPDEDKASYTSGGPVSYLENKSQITEALDKAGWPVSQKDLLLLEREIQQADIYIKQAQDLYDASTNGENLATEDEKDTETDKDDEPKERLKSSSPRQFESASRRNSSCSSSSKDSGLGEVIQAKSRNSKSEDNMTRVKVNRSLDVLRGQRVIGRNKDDGFYYPGHVVKCKDVRFAEISFDEIGHQTVPTKFILPITGAIARPRIMLWDHVLARVINQDTGMECYVPGMVEMTPRRTTDQAKFFTVMLYTGQKSHFLRNHLVKISKMRYMLLVSNITENAEKKAREEEEEDNKSDASGSKASSRESSRSRKKSRSRSRSQSRSQSRSRSRSRSRSKSRSRSRSRSKSPARSDATNGSRETKAEKQQRQRLEKWKKHLEKQQKRQERQQKKLKKQAHRLAKLRERLKADENESASKQLLEMLLAEIAGDKKPLTPKSPAMNGDRTEQWVNGNTTEARIQIGSGSDADHADVDDTPPFLLALRHSLSPVPEGEEILARWSDEGWYYKGIVRHNCGDGSYLVEDSVGDLEKIWREDIITDNDDAENVLQQKDAVIALHPDYAFSYAPGVILDVSSDLWITVRFYDGVEGRMPREEGYLIPNEKFEMDVAYILAGEEQWVGQAVVARNNDTGLYQLGAVRERLSHDRLYSIEWSDGSYAEQTITYIFGPFTKRHPLSSGDRVLAIMDESDLVYAPGSVTGTSGNCLVVKFYNGKVSKSVDPQQSFWLSEEYFENAVTFLKTGK